MINRGVYEDAAAKFSAWFGRPHTTAAYAPGRAEVLGNHTDYNEGFVLSAAINLGTFFLAAPAETAQCRLVAGDIVKEVSFDVASPVPSSDDQWSNYVKGMLAGLREQGSIETGFLALFLGNIPLGAGLSSSAALEMASGLALCSLYNMDIDRGALAAIGHKAEHEFAGVKCGMLDQISSLHGRDGQLVLTDFRSLEIRNVPLGEEVCFLMCNTGVKHSLVDSDYNERRQKCEEAALFFSSALEHPVSALRDVTLEEWQEHSPRMDQVAARRSAHVIGENTRVLQGADLLAEGNLLEFGSLMFESHASSRLNFENSCDELDFIVDRAQEYDGVMGARLSGGGFGGSAVLLTHPPEVDSVSEHLAAAYGGKFEHPCDIRVIKPSPGAAVIHA